MSSDAVVLEVAYVSLTPQEATVEESIWREVDETQLATAVRRRLAENGVRCGLIGSQLPAAVRQLLDSTDHSVPGGADGQTGVDDTTPRQQRLQSRAGRRGKILASSRIQDRLDVLYVDQGAVRGRTFERAQCIFGVHTFPQGDGQVRLQLTPEIHHGQPRLDWVGHEGSFRLETDRNRESYDELTMELLLAPGHVFIVGCTPELKGLGANFFAETSGAVPRRNMLLIRLVQTQFDDLFAPDEIHAPLATPAN